ncbi:hypothetical protein BU15DRAFT_80506 [Melanogaster broomeanus]|nr:hypothetical protein BU15DRAFT_80506 [Melanogaster broomeanus]
MSDALSIMDVPTTQKGVGANYQAGVIRQAATKLKKNADEGADIFIQGRYYLPTCT